MSKFLVALSILGVGVTAARAADLPARTYTKAPVVAPVARYSWTGCHVGGNAGWIGGSDRLDLEMSGGFLNPLNIFSVPANRAPLAHSYEPNRSSGVVGAEVGCDWQAPGSAFVFGVAADISWSGLRETVNAAYGPTVTPVGTMSSHTVSVTKDLDWFSTFRGRAGYAFDRFLVYGTAGAAVARIRSTTNVLFASDGLDFFNTNLVGQATDTRWGWAAGVGAEYAFGGNWSIKAEYLHLDFGNSTYQSPCVDAACVVNFNNVGIPLGAYATTVRAREEIVRVGLNYTFGAAPVVARY